MPRKLRKSFVRHPRANLFLTISLAGVFQQPRLVRRLTSPRFARRFESTGVLPFLTMQRPVLIVIDMVNAFLEKWASAPKQRLVRSINDLVGIMRQFGHPIIWVRQEFEPDLGDAFREMKTKGIRITIKGTVGSQIDPDLAVAQSDPVVIKKRYSAFSKTDLDQVAPSIEARRAYSGGD
jgi:Isochorismatase family